MSVLIELTNLSKGASSKAGSQLYFFDFPFNICFMLSRFFFLASICCFYY